MIDVQFLYLVNSLRYIYEISSMVNEKTEFDHLIQIHLIVLCLEEDGGLGIRGRPSIHSFVRSSVHSFVRSSVHPTVRNWFPDNNFKKIEGIERNSA